MHMVMAASMPGTRNRVVLGAGKDIVTNKNAESSDGESKCHGEMAETSDITPASLSLPLIQYEKGKKGKVAYSGNDIISAKCNTKLQINQARSLNKSTHFASPKKRCQMKKEDHSAMGIGHDDEKDFSKIGVQPTSKSAVQGASKKDVPPMPKPTVQDAGDVFSPRRSGRGVVPNRRFQDMELNFGRKRSREEVSGEPNDNRAKTSKRRVGISKVLKTPVKQNTRMDPGPVNIKDSETKCVEETLNQLKPSSPTVSSLSIKQQSSSTSQASVASHLALSPIHSSTSRLIRPSVYISTTQVSAVAKTQMSPKSAASESPALKTSSLPTVSSQSHVTVVSSLPQSNSPSATAARSVAITSSRAVLNHKVPPPECNVSVITDYKDEIFAQSLESATKAGDKNSVESTALSVEDGAVSGVSAVDIPDNTSVTEVADVSSHPGTGDPGMITISITDQDKEKLMGESPGRVVGKSCPELPSSVSKSVFIVRNAGNQSSSVPVGSTNDRPSQLSCSYSNSAKIKTVGENEAGAGDVLSVVEVSPNKKVPVVLAERKEHSVVTGKVIKVISSQGISHLPAELQKIVSAHISQQKVSNQLFSQSANLQTQKPQFVISSDDSSENISGKKSTGKAEEEVITEHNSFADEAVVHFEESPQIILDTEGHLTESTSASPTVVISTTSSTDRVSEDANLNYSDASNLQKKDQDSRLSSESSEPDEDESSNGKTDEMTTNGKYATSGTQTPYTKSCERRVITVHVHPPSKRGEKNTEVVTVTKVDKDNDSSDIVEADEREDILRSDAKGNFVFVDLPEGTTVKQQYVRTSERYDSDPSFYTVDERGMFTCHICHFKTYRRPNFYKHKKKHLGLRPFGCDQCHYRAATSSNLKRHLEIHKDIRNHKCHLCDLNFRQKIHLERHIKYRHEEKRVKCPLCDYVCANENPDLKVHIKRRHVSQTGSEAAMNAFKCQECGIISTSKRDLRQHLKFHSKGPELKLFCNMCSFVTDCESRLRRHQYIHTKEKPFQCGLCNYRGSQKEHVLRHMRTQHNIEISRKHRNKKMGADKGSEGEGSKEMERADYTSEEKIFACNHCTMKFSKLINLYKHLHTQHRDIMPSEQEEFSCVVCDFHTTSKKNLLVHMRRHNVTDQLPPSHVYSCVLCRYMNPKRRNLFQHMRKKHHIEIVMRNDGSSTCYVAVDPVAAGNTRITNGLRQATGNPNSVSVLPLSDLIATVSQPTDLPVSAENGSITVSSCTIPTTIKMEDLALVVSNPQSNQSNTGNGKGDLMNTSPLEAITVGALTQDDAAEAIQGLQALAQHGVLEAETIVEEQVQVMGSDEQTTLVIDPGSLEVEQLVQPKTEPLEIVEIENSQLLEQVTNASIISEEEEGILGDARSGILTVHEGSVEGSDFQLSADQLMNLSTGDLLEINGEMYKVDVSVENNPDGSHGQQIISFEPANITHVTLPEQPNLSETSLEMADLS